MKSFGKSEFKALQPLDLETAKQKEKRERREKNEKELNQKAQYVGTGCKYF